MPDRVGRRRRAAAGRGRHRRGQRRRVRQIDLLVAICARAPERFRAPPVQAGGERRSSAAPTARTSPSSMPSSTPARASRPPWIRSASGRSPTPGRQQLQRDIDNFKAALKGVKVTEAFMPVAAPASVIPDRKNEYYKSEEELIRAIGAGDAHRIQDDRRCRLHPAARRRARRHHLRPHGAAGELRRLPQMGGAAHGGAQRRHRRACRRTASAITSAGAAGPARTSPTCRSRTSST